MQASRSPLAEGGDGRTIAGKPVRVRSAVLTGNLACECSAADVQSWRERDSRKGGPAITRSDLPVINKINLAPHVGASLEVMERDARRMREGRPFVFTNLKTGEGLEVVINFLKQAGGLEAQMPQIGAAEARI